jgi:hypothetical protein
MRIKVNHQAFYILIVFWGKIIGGCMKDPFQMKMFTQVIGTQDACYSSKMPTLALQVITGYAQGKRYLLPTGSCRATREEPQEDALSHL